MEWRTPSWLFGQLNEEFRFTLDSCASADNALCHRYLSPEQDGLRCLWFGSVWMNSPYGRSLGTWVRKAFISAQTTADVVVALVPCRTDTQWWHRYVMKAPEIRLIEGRVQFSNYGINAPFPCCAVIFRAGDHHPAISVIRKRP